MFLRTVELAFARFQARRDPRALAIVFDRTAGELLRVARHLASSEASAEDLVQSTFVTAIEAADGHRRGDPVLPWLLGILANQARHARRRARRQLDPARLRVEVPADVATEVERNELGAELQAAIARLPEAYRPVLRMWLELGLEAQEIARTLERPAGTVRAQVSRGLDLLRRALPHGVTAGAAIAAAAGRGLAAVRTAVLAECRGTSIGIGSTLAVGGLLVLHHKLLVSGAAAVLVFAVWGLVALAAPAAPIAEVAAAGPLPAAADLGQPVAAASPGRAVVAPEAEAEAAVRAMPPAAASTGELVVELVSAADGRPLPGLGVALQSAADHMVIAVHTAWVTTGADGIARFPGLRPDTWHIDIDRLGAIAAGDVVAGNATHRRVEVPAGIRVEGTIVDEADRPVADAEVVVHGNRLEAPVVARGDALGRFGVDHLLSRLHLQARKSGHVASDVVLVEGAPGGKVEVALRLRTGGRRIFGRVSLPDGAPLADANVLLVAADAVQVGFWDPTAVQRRPLFLRSGADGAFATDEAGRDRQLVLLEPRRGDIAPCWQFVEAGDNEAFVELRAPQAAVLTGRVTGDGVAGITVQATAQDQAPLGFLNNVVGVRLARVAADGTYRIDGLAAGRYEVEARRQFTTVARTQVVVAAATATSWDFDLGVAARRMLQIVARSAVPLPANVVVMVGPHVPDNSAPAIVPLGADGTAQVARADARNVDVVLCLMPGDRVFLQLARRQDVPLATGIVEFQLDAAQLPSRRIRGRLVDATGAPIANRSLSLTRVDASGLQARDMPTTDADGRFASVELPAGDYWIMTGGQFAMERRIGNATLTIDRDEDVGSIQATR